MSTNPQDTIIAHIKNIDPLIWIKSSEKERVLGDLFYILTKRFTNRQLFLRLSSVGAPLVVDKAEDLVKSPSLNPEDAVSLPEMIRCIVDKDNMTEIPTMMAEILEKEKNQEYLKNSGAVIYVDHLDYKMSYDQVDARWLFSAKEKLKEYGISIIGIAPSFNCVDDSNIPNIISNHFVVVDYDLPDYETLGDLFDRSIKEFKRRIGEAKKKKNKDENEEKKEETIYKLDYSKDERHQIIRAGQGLMLAEFQRILSYSLRKDGQILPVSFRRAKAESIKKSSILELFDTSENLDNVGGFEEAKSFIRQWKNCFTEEAEKFGVEVLRGLIFVGPPGGGKSLFAKAAARELDLPLIRLDIGKVLSGTVGSSEARAREACKMVESVCGCILWIDEVEKAMAGTTSSDRTDSGVMARVFGTFLTAMQEGLGGAIVLATSNNIEQIPPEFIRRFEDVFFVDLPEDQERQDIFSIHLKKRKRNPEDFDLSALSEATEDYTGAEIEKSVKRAIASKFSLTNGKEEITTEDIVNAADTVTPISTLMGDKIKALQNWAKKHGARNASKVESNGQKTKRMKKREKNDTMDAIGKI